MKPYDADLAYIHDTGFTRFVSRAAPGLLRLLQQHGIAKGVVVDAGCGSGVWVRVLSDRGYNAIGIDISPAMIRIAKRHAPAARFRVGSFLDTDLPACDAVTCIGEVVNYAFDPRAGFEALSAFFSRVYAALSPGGILAFDVVEPGVEGGGTQRRFSEGADWAILLEAREDRKQRTLERQIVSFRRVGRLYRRTEEVHRLNLFPRAQLLAALTRAGFEAHVLSGYGRFRFAPAHTGFVARKPSPDLH